MMNMRPVQFLRLALVTALCLAPATIHAAAMPPIAVFQNDNFTAGAWKITALDSGSRAYARSHPPCIASPDPIVHAGYDKPTAHCTHRLVENTPERAVIIYSCRGEGSGRTQILRDGRNHFTVDAQGISGAAPFGIRAEYKRTGRCPAQ